MGKLWRKLKANIRLIVQFFAALGSNGWLRGYVLGGIYRGSGKYACVPGLNCYSCPGALGACPIGALQAVLSSRDYRFSFYVIGFLLFFGGLFGRFVCGWLCPFGLVQDLLHKIPFPGKRKHLPGHKWLKYLKYAVLAVLVVLLPLTVLDVIGQGSPWFCKYVCPSGTLGAGWTLAALDPALAESVGPLFTWKSAVLIAILILSIIAYRPFCKYLCPLGAIYGLFNPVALCRLRVDAAKCISCGKCAEACPMGVYPARTPGSAECIRCGRCKKVCPKDAIK